LITRHLAAFALSLVFTAPVLAQLKAQAGDWPGWRGPNRDGINTETGLAKQWPPAGPPLVWKIKGLGTGYSAPSIANGRIYLMGTVGKQEHVIALDMKDGHKIWSTPIGTVAGGYPGPRCTPTVDGEYLFALSSDGKLVRIAHGDGKISWKSDLKADFGGKHGSWAYAESPLIDGDVLVCTPGGQTAAMVALNKNDGKAIWKATTKGLTGRYGSAGYSSAIVATINGAKQYVQFLSGGVVGVDAKNGKILWNYNAPANGTANISTPVVSGDLVFAASNYNTGGGLARITNEGAKEVAFLKEMQNHHGGMILVGDYLYGAGNNSLLCVEFKTGKIRWNAKGSVGKGSIAYADGMLIHRNERGVMALVDASPAGYKEHGRFTQPDRSDQNAWTHPVIAGGKLYVRDWDILLCYDLK
jgi:outer membrane protein assembly factor BamB